MRLDSPVVLATAGTLAIHLLLAIAGDAFVVLSTEHGFEPPPSVELIDIEPVMQPPPPPLPQPEPEPEPTPEVTEPPRPDPKPVPRAVRRPSPPPTDEPTPPPPTNASSDSGGAPVAQMADIAPSAVGIPVARGKPVDRIGRGGRGTGTGSGSGAGSSDAPAPVSVATIQKPAMPRGDFSYFDASKNYPPEAKALGIEGVIKVRLVVDATGKVKSSVLLNRLGHGLDELALAAARRIQFEPARDTDDRPVASVVVWTFNMTLPK